MVDKCYRSAPFASDAKRVEFLFELYEELVKKFLTADLPIRTILPHSEQVQIKQHDLPFHSDRSFGRVHLHLDLFPADQEGCEKIQDGLVSRPVLRHHLGGDLLFHIEVIG